METRDNDRALLSDPGALDGLRGFYSGNLDLIDVLRWRVDPSALGSDGSRSPIARAAALNPIIYGRADTPETARQREAAVAEAEALLAAWHADSAALDDALVAHSEPGPALATPHRAFPTRLALLVGAGVVALAVIVGLVFAGQARPGENVAAGPASGTPRPTPSAEKVTVAPTASPRPIVAPPVITPSPEPDDTDLRPDYFEENIHSVIQVPVNGAPIDYARGATTVDDYGVPLSYVVASGDVFELIAKRFDLGTDYLASINAVRRDVPTEIFVGDTINLGATTILRIGDQNGVVYHHVDRLPEPHMPQD